LGWKGSKTAWGKGRLRWDAGEVEGKKNGPGKKSISKGRVKSGAGGQVPDNVESFRRDGGGEITAMRSPKEGEVPKKSGGYKGVINLNRIWAHTTEKSFQT